ncbi:SDR family oxidoreductase [Luteococcus sp. H138]|uniref:SDR family NAD(P)-dependent oxidoreductase n=1 Tax=unclassified Luteococcus TaxID=2639923 RepID=UPI00313AB616
MDWLGLQGRVVVVTGGGSGIGRRVCLELASVGAVPVAVDANGEAATQTAALVAAAGATGSAHAVDVTDADACRRVFAQVVEDHGSLHGLVNAAGMMRAGSLAELDTADWELVMRVNVTGCLIAAQAALPHLAEGAALVHIASISGSNPQPSSGAYSTSKAAVKMLSRDLAFELGPRGVRSNTVSPGLVRTPMSEAFYQAPGVLEKREASVPLRRIAGPQDMADAVLYLLSARASYVTGQDIIVDGGLGQALMSFLPRPGY